jgi:endonuclease YncB( thermonuclease family)
MAQIVRSILTLNSNQTIMNIRTLLVKAVITAFASLSLACAWAYEAKVVGVSDGDTITVLDGNKTQHKIRVAGIDAPEKAQDFGSRSKEHLSDLVFGKTVNIPESKIDKYGRTVSRVMFGNTDAGLEQIKAGMAWHYKKYEIEQSPADRTSYSSAENLAKASKIGLWSQSVQVRPEDFRHGDKASKPVGSGAECPCGTNNLCTGPRGGQFCMDGGGKKKYAK